MQTEKDEERGKERGGNEELDEWMKCGDRTRAAEKDEEEMYFFQTWFNPLGIDWIVMLHTRMLSPKSEFTLFYLSEMKVKINGYGNFYSININQHWIIALTINKAGYITYISSLKPLSSYLIIG